METSLARRIEALGVLAEPVRRDLYLYVCGRGEPVGRAEAAQALGIKRSLAAFHLDRLAEEGLLEVTYARPPGRSGPGAGRTAKLYRRARLQIELSLPSRSYELAARLLAEAISSPGDARAALHRRARAFGTTVGAEAGREGDDRAETAMLDRLRSLGYEPFKDAEGTIRLRNCPFHGLVEEHRHLVCGMNRELIGGLVDGAGATSHAPRLDPREGLCCVALEPRTT